MPGPTSELLPLDRLTPWLAAHLPGFTGPVTAQKTAAGQSNPTFILTTPAARYVLRRKPPGDLLPSAHAIEREYRVMRALAGSAVPVPRVYCLCADETVIGKPFFVMAHVAGETFDDPRCPGLARDVRAALYAAMNRTLADLHRVDVVAAGLADFGRPGNYFERQLTRWSRQYRATETQTIPAMEALMVWLGAHLPPDDGQVALVHGDWRLDNLLVDRATGAVRAVIDWELSTLGHPLADLGAQIMQWRMPVGAEGRGLDGADRAALGIPSDEEYVAMYARNAGLGHVPDLRFAIAFSFFRMAAILQGVKRRALEGNASNPEMARKLGTTIPLFAQRALQGISAADATRP